MKKILFNIYLGFAFIPLIYQVGLYLYLYNLYIETHVWPKYGVNIVIPESLRECYFFYENIFVCIFFIAFVNIVLGIYTRTVKKGVFQNSISIGGMITSAYFLVAVFIDTFDTYAWLVD